jgi:hypothetical protein
MKHIDFTYEDKAYKLAFSRESVRNLESQGFDIEAISSQPVTMIPLLFYGAFSVYHRGIKRRKVDEIWNCIADKNGLVLKLVELYGETIEDLLEESEGTEAKKITWEVSQ